MTVAVKQLVKKCTRCHEVKPLGAFGLHPKNRDGRKSWCRECDADYIREQRHDPNSHHGSYARAQARAYRAASRVLRDRHGAEFDQLLREAMDAEGLGAS